MLSIKDATAIVKKELPKCVPKCCVLYKNLYVFVVFTDDKIEGKMDPFYSVDCNTGKFEEFVFLSHIPEIISLLEKPTKIF